MLGQSISKQQIILSALSFPRQDFRALGRLGHSRDTRQLFAQTPWYGVQHFPNPVVKVLPSICQQIWNMQQWPQNWKRSVFIPVSKKGNAKECSNYRTIALISHASKVMLRILQARLQQYVNRELPDVQAGFRKGRGTRKIANIHWIIEKAKRVPEKRLFLLY